MMCSKVQKESKQLTRMVGLALIALFFGMSTACTKKVDDKDTTINAVLKANVKGLDPARASDLYSGTVVSQMYEGLLEYNYLKRPYQLQPALADGMPVVSADGLTHTFKIKKGVKFQDNAAFPDGKGRELTAEDFIYSFKRLADPSDPSDGFWIIDGKVKGINEWAEAVKAKKADYSTPVEGLQAPDKYTLVIKLTQPYYQLDYVLAMAYAAVVPKEAVQKYGAEFLNNPVGTGPFMLEKSSDWIRNSKITLKKNPNWRGETYPSEGEASDRPAGLLADSGKKLPFADQLVFTELPEDQPRWQNYMKGNFDFVEIPNDNFDSAIKNDKVLPELAAKGMHLDISPNVEVTYYAFNMKDPIIGKSKDLRHALSLAVDRETYIQRFWNGRAIAAQSPISPGVESYDANYKNPYTQFSVEKAKEALAKAGYPDGKGLPEFSYDTLADSKSRQQAEFVAQNWAKIGVKVKINANTWPQFQDRIKNGQTQIFGIAWGADYPDAQNFFQLFYSKNVSPGPNDSGFVSADFDKLYEDSLKLPPGKAREEIYRKMRDLVVEESPWIFDLHRKAYRLVHGWVNNFKNSEMQNDIYKYIRIDSKKRAEIKSKL
jgi:oligopeptide transport system substrate-binding protein